MTKWIRQHKQTITAGMSTQMAGLCISVDHADPQITQILDCAEEIIYNITYIPFLVFCTCVNNITPILLAEPILHLAIKCD